MHFYSICRIIVEWSKSRQIYYLPPTSILLIRTLYLIDVAYHTFIEATEAQFDTGGDFCDNEFIGIMATDGNEDSMVN